MQHRGHVVREVLRSPHASQCAVRVRIELVRGPIPEEADERVGENANVVDSEVQALVDQLIGGRPDLREDPEPRERILALVVTRSSNCR
jgi:hypothetical protein